MSDPLNLLIEHARLADERRRLIEAASDSHCTIGVHVTCIGAVFQARANEIKEDGWQAVSFEELWDQAVFEGRVCAACQQMRRLKKERVAVSRKLGAIRAAITRVGRRLAKEQSK